MVNLKLITRNLIRDKSHSILNITGLAIGFACAFSVIVWVKNEYSYDKYLPEADRTYRLTFETNISGTSIHFARCWEKWVWQIPAAFPQIEEMVRLSPFRHTAIKVEENKLYSDRIFATDSNFFKVFGIDLLEGDIEKVLNEPYSSVISLTLARKCFGEKNPIGQNILLSGEYDTEMTSYTIKGVMKDTPDNSHIHFDILTSFTNPQEAPAWAYVYLLLKKNTNPGSILSGLPAFISEVEKERENMTFTPSLQKITDIHLFSNKDREVEPNSNITSIYLFALAAFILLLVSWVNYYNLNKARLITLQKQIFVQKLNGSDNLMIIFQSLAESLACVLLAFVLALMLMDIAGYRVSIIFGSELLNNGIRNLISSWPILLAVVFAAVLAGSLPVLLNIIRKNSFKGFGDSLIHNRVRHSSYGILMTIQFCLSIILLVAAITIYQQKEYLLSSGPGKISSDILVFKKQNWEIRSKYRAIRDRSMQNPLIKGFTASMEEPTGETLDAIRVESSALDEDHKDNQVYFLSVEDNFLDFFDIPLIAGRNFSHYNPDRKGEDYILNETAVRLLGWTPEEAIGNPFSINFFAPDIFYGGTVIGVVRDFNYTTLKQEIKPYFLFQKPIFYLCFLVEVDSARKEEAISSLKAIWDEELPDYPFQYEFLSDLYKSAYSKELTQANLTSFFSLLAIVIICLGLYSVTSVLVGQRTKEIGIRKVNGARDITVMLMLNSNFIKWFIISFIIACPVAWYAMHKWLDNFAYKTGVHWWVFAVSGGIILLITLLTVSLKSWRAASRNPVEALRYE